MKKIYSAALIIFGLGVANSQVFETGDFAQMTDVSNEGVAVGNVLYSSHIMWSEATGTVTIGVPSSGERVSGITTISSDGKYIAGTMTNPTTEQDEIARYDVATKTWKYLGAIAANAGSSVWGMTSDGSAIVGLGDYGGFLGHAVKWTEATGMVDMGSTMDGTSSRANGINDDGSVVVGWQDDDFDRFGVYWKNGVQAHIKDTDGNFVGEAGAVTPDGKTIIGYNIDRPYIWNETKGYTELAHENPMYEGSTTAISDDGKTVVGFFREWGTGPFSGGGFIWTEEKGRVDLNEYVSSLGYNDLGITFALPLAISPNGRYIVGLGADGNSNLRGFVIKLPAPNMATTETTKTKVSMYPNPVKDVVTITNADKISNVEVYNFAGQKVLSTASVKNNKLDLSGLVKGAYVLKVENNGNSESIKFIKN